MRNHEEAAGKGVQIVLEDLQGADVEVVGGFVQDDKIRAEHEGFEQVEALELAAGEGGEFLLLHFGVEEKALQHFGGGHLAAVAGLDHLGVLGDVVVNAEEGIEAFVLLPVVGKMGVHAHFDAAEVGLHLAGDDLEQSGFTAAVGTEDADPLAGLEIVVDIGEQLLGTVTFTEFMQLQDGLAEAVRLKGDVELGVGDEVALGKELAHAVHMVFGLGGAGFGAAVQPVELFFQLGLAAGFLALDVGGADELAAHIGGIDAIVEVAAAVVDLQHAVADGIQEIAVVGYEDDGFFGGGQEVLQPFDGVKVEVVGGLVQDEDVRFGHQNAGEVGLAALSSGEQGEGFGKIGETEDGEHGLVAVFLVAFGGKGDGRLDVVQNAHIGGLRGFLRQISELEAAADDDAAFRGIDHGGEHFEQGGFAAAVHAHQADLVAGVDAEVEPGKDDLAAYLLGQVGEGDDNFGGHDQKTWRP